MVMVLHAVTEVVVHTVTPTTNLKVATEDSQGERSNGVLTRKVADKSRLVEDVVALNRDLGDVEGHIGVAFMHLVHRIGIDGAREMIVANSLTGVMKREISVDMSVTLRNSVDGDNGMDSIISLNGAETPTDTVVIPKHVMSHHRGISIAMMKDDGMGDNRDPPVTARRDGINRHVETTADSTSGTGSLIRGTADSTKETGSLIRGTWRTELMDRTGSLRRKIAP